MPKALDPKSSASANSATPAKATVPSLAGKFHKDKNYIITPSNDCQELFLPHPITRERVYL